MNAAAAPGPHRYSRPVEASELLPEPPDLDPRTFTPNRPPGTLLADLSAAVRRLQRQRDAAAARAAHDCDSASPPCTYWCDHPDARA